MSKKILYLVGILLVIIVGTILFWYYCCGSGTKNFNTETSATNNTIASISDEKKTDLPPPSSESDSLKDWKAIREKLNANPLTVYFGTSKSEVQFTPEEIQKIESINNYLSINPQGKLLITGHSDNTGKHDLNVKLGQSRADFVKKYLVRMGADKAKIVSSSKGPDDPISDNNTPEGKAKNRRTVILITN